VFASGAAYEPYVGRWSRLVAREFVPWLGVGSGQRWLDVGCGSGVLTRMILELEAPRAVVGVDPSEGMLAFARDHMSDARGRFEVGDARALPFEPAAFDVTVAGLVLNFVPDPAQGLADMVRVTRSGGTVGVYVWDYADRMQMLRYFWDAAIAIDPTARDHDEGQRFGVCHPDRLRELFDVELSALEVKAIDAPTHFKDFDDYWSPFLSGHAPAPVYVASLDEDRRTALRERLRSTLPVAADASIPLIARAWAIRGRVS
jgi:SAM-dependent methyltransferase